ncbi:MAG TPA: glycosyltransferase family 39 protein, partial [Actinomycetota bacterium]|nr:glycosyltransferase family 39 protein [Actinomycetota bacterium]
MKALAESRQAPAPVRRSWASLVARAMTVLAVIAAVGAIALYLVLAIKRVGYPYAIEWLEGGAVEEVGRVLHGRQIYTAPSINYVAYPYTPLYFWVSAAVARLTGLSYLPLRLVSMTASLASVALLYRLVADEGGRVAGAVAGGLFAAAFRWTGGFYDVSRVDSLMMALVLACLLMVARARRPAGFAVAGVLAFLAALTKQSALIAVAPVAVWLVARPGTSRRNGLIFVGAALIPLAGVALALDATTSGWFATITGGVLLGHGVDPTWWLGFWRLDLFPTVLPGAALVALAVILCARGRRASSGRLGLYLCAGAGMVLAAYVSRLHSASSENVLIPVAAALALLGGLAFAGLAGRRAGLRMLVAALCLAQFGLLAYNPAAQLPPAAQTATAKRLAAVLRQLPGEVLIVSHPWETTLAGKGTHAHAGAIFDDVRTSDRRANAALEASIAAAVSSERFTV